MTESVLVQPANPMLPANEPERLAALHRYQVLDTPAEVAFDRLTALAARLFKMPTVLISLVDESRAWFKSSIGFSATEVLRNETMCSFAVLTDEPLIVPDTRLDDRFVCNPFVQCEPGMRFYAGAPLIDRDGFNLGTLCLLDSVPHAALTAEEEATLVDLAAMVVDELELRLAARQIASVDAALVEITQGVSRVTGQDFFDALVRHFAKVLGTDYVYIGLVEGTEPKMMKTIATCDRGNIVENLEYRLQDTPCWEAIEQRKICCHPRNVKAQFPNAVLLQLLPVESYVAIPFYGADGSVLGLLGVMDGKPLANVQLAESLLTIFASRIATELERQQYESMLVEQTRLLEAVSTGQPLDECLSALCSSIAKLSPNTRACVLLTDDRRTKFTKSITPDFPPSLSQGLKDAPINELAIGTCSAAVYCGEPVTCSDIASDDLWSQKWRDLSIAHGIRACHSLPIMGVDNLPLGSVTLCFNEARSPTDWEYRLGEFGTKIASIAIDRLRSIEKLSESEERLNLALTAADMATWDTDLSTGQAIWSDNHFRILGYEPAIDGVATVEMCLSRVHPDDNESVMQAWETAQRDRSLFRIENRFVRADTGVVVWVATTGRFLDNQAGEAMRFVGVMFDISLRKQAEIALVESQQFVQKIANTMPGMLYVYDLVEQRNIYSNRHSLELVGYTPEQLEELGTDITPRIVHPDDLPRAMAYQAQFSTALPGEVLEIEYRVQQANGEWCWLLSQSTVFNTTPAGNVRQILGVSIDISLRKQAEANLERSNARFESAMLAVRGTVYEWNLHTQIMYRSAGLFELLGVRAEDALPTNEWWTERMHPDDLERVQAEFLTAPAGIDRFESEYRISHAAGHWVYVSDRSYFQYDSHGKLLKVVGFNTDITDRKRAEEELYQSQLLVQRQLMEIEAIYQTAPIGLTILDRDLRYVRLNQRLAEMNGIDIDDHIGRTLREIVPTVADENEPLLHSIFATGEPLLNIEISGETRALPGVERTWIENCYPLRDETGQIAGINVVVQEITDRKRAEAELERVNGILTATFDGTSDVIFVKDLQGKYIIANTTAAQWVNASVADVLGRDDTSLFPPEIARDIITIDRQVIETGESIVYEEEIPYQGTLRSLLTAKYPWRVKGQIVGVIGIARDITDRKRAETALQESQIHRNFLLSAAEFGDWDLNLADGTANRSLQHDRIFGYESLLAQWTYEMFLDHVLPEDRAEVDRKQQYAIANKEPWDFECRIRRADRQVRWIWASGYVYHNAQGVATRMLGLVGDITDRKTTEIALAERNQELNSFVHTVSHDLKAPLRAIANLSVWIEEDLAGQLPPENQQQFQSLRTRVKRMESMIDSLLLYAKSGRQEAKLETFNVAELLSEIIDSLAPQQGFRIEIQSPLPTLTTKRVFLSQVLTNLISNAIKHHHSVTGNLHIWAIEHSDHYEFILKDDGPGIAPEHHETVFAIFQTLKGMDNTDSTGVGLAIVKKIVETEAGTIRLESSLGQGTTFYVTWPKSDR